MKRTIISLLLCALACASMAQVSGQNYIRSRRMLDATGGSHVDNITYYDGQGRAFQTVSKSVQSGTVKERMATLQEYDGKGRATVGWLPTPVSEDYTVPATLKSTAKGSTGYNDTCPFETTVYENSPLDRVQLQYGAGAAWYNSHPVSSEWMTNTASGDLSCKKYTTDGTTLSGGTATHAAGTLYVTKTTDEDGNVSYTFVDGEERTLLERRMNGTEQLDTYYVYDDYGRLCFVLQPMYQTTANVSLYAFQYRYNNRGLCIWKKLPGAEHILYEYDGADRLVFSQDGVQRTSGKWTFYVYDNLNRLVQQGENTSKAVSASGVYLQNYYDNYDFVGDVGFTDDRFVDDTSGHAKGSLTGTIMNVFGSSEKIYTAYYYDAKGRVKKTVENNLLGGYNTTETTYTFTDQPVTITLTHTASGKLTQTEVYTYSYDHSDRISSVSHKLNGNTAVTLASYTYDKFGRIATKKLHGSSTNQLTYAYNIRSWLTGITGGKFTQNLTYNNGSTGFNGNITAMNWTANGSSHSYSFTYDGVNRMLNATHGTGAYTEKVTGYDKNGNIQALQRYNNGTLVDNLTYTYSGNQLTKVEDATGNATGFTNGASQANEYTYDNNGNLTKDLNKGITNISYNVLSLPQVVTFSNGSTITYLYAADGRKLRTVHVVNGTTTTTDYSGNVIYENGTQKLLLTEEGYIDLSASTPAYYYYLKDHQGNNRVIINSSGTVAETNHYYPFGGVLSTSSSSVQPYKYNGKEYDTKNSLNWYDYGARHYDAALGRWHVVDPLAEKYYTDSPYTYCGSNPVNRIDSTGMDYWSTSNPDEISRFWNWFSQGSDYSYSFITGSWFRMNDNEFIKAYEKYGQQALVYNDQTNKLYSSYVTYENNEIVVNGVSATAVGFPVSTNGFGMEDAYSLGLTSGGIYTGVNEMSNVYNGRWKGKNGKWNDLSWGGNRYTGARRIAMSKANLYNGIGRGLFAVDLAVNSYKAYKNYEGLGSLLEPMINMTVSAIGTFGGPGGLLFSGIYYTMSLGSRPIYPIKVYRPIAPRDNTFVAPYNY